LVSSVNLQHLAPLRQQLAEAAFRHRRVLEDVRTGGRGMLASVNDVLDVPTKPLEWFVGEGCYLMSTSYYTARLYYSCGSSEFCCGCSDSKVSGDSLASSLVVADLGS
jgi:hypothetical protein